jgi:phosphorylcholine metabolism protein LicD
MKSTAGKSNWIWLALGLILIGNAGCARKITGTWYYKSIKTQDTAKAIPVSYGDALNLHKFEVQVFDYHLRVADKNATGHWTMTRCGRRQCLNLTYHPQMTTRVFKVDKLTYQKLRLTENGTVFTFSRYPD